MKAYDRMKDILYGYESAGLIEGDPVKVLSYLSDDVIGIGMGEQGAISSKKEVMDIMLATIRKDITAAYTLDIQNIIIHMNTNTSASLCAKVYVKRLCQGIETISGFMQSLVFVFREDDWKICMLHASPIMLTEESIESYPMRFADNTLARLKADMQQDTFELMNKSFSGGIIGIYTKKPFKLYFSNDMLIEMMGYERKEFEEGCDNDIVQMLNLRQEKVLEIAKSKDSVAEKDFFWRDTWKKRDGSDIWVEVCSRKGEDEHGAEVLVCIVTDITELITLQMETEQQNQTILASIAYGSKIQKNLLPDSLLFQQSFRDHGIIWSPKDILGGDIYWLKRFAKGSVLIVGDCTGHGIPGALLTMLLVSILDNVVQAGNCQDTAEILCQIDQKMAGVINGKKNDCDIRTSRITDIHDGCDVVVLFISEDGTVYFSASNMYIFCCDGKKVERYKGQRLYVGEGTIKNKESVNTAIIPSDKRMRFYIMSDGITDQIGGEDQKPYGYRRMNQIMLDHYKDSQKEILEKIWADFERYQGGNIRRDDVEMISFVP